MIKTNLSIALMIMAAVILSSTSVYAGGTDPYGNEDPNKKVLKSGLLGAATGAIASEASGGKAGKGALIGAGTNVVGGALLDMLTGPSQQQAPPQQQYYQSAPVQQQYQQAPQPTYNQQPQYQQQYYQDPPRQAQPVYYQQAPAPVQDDPNKKILKSGLLGAATGGIAASASGGKAGTGALIGAGTSVIGGALLDTLTAPSQPRQQPQQYYQQAPPQQYYQQQAPQYSQSLPPAPTKKIIRKYDAEGNVISEEETYT